MKLLVICGPTATGKTELAHNLAKKYSGELISADSRQVYKYMDIGTGKEKDLVGQIHGYDLVDPKENFSVSQYVELINPIILDISKRNKLPILVGGTGLYIKGVVDGIETSTIPQDQNLRKELANKSPDELYKILESLNTQKATGMNNSDKNNPRRLVRAIEISKSNSKLKIKNQNFDVLMIGLNAPKEELFKKIEKRVNKRVEEKLEDEINKLLKMGVTWDKQSMNTLGYREWEDYFEGKATKESVIDNWISDEKKYVKKQLTWFKKDKRINWFNVNEPNYRNKVEKLVSKWYI